MVPVRIAIRLSSKLPAAIPGPAWEHFAATAMHYSQYALMVGLPASGVAMGYFGGKGLPFFGIQIPGASKEYQRPDIVKNAFWFHKNAGQVFEYLTLAHVGAAGFHAVKGTKIFSRINPFA